MSTLKEITSSRDLFINLTLRELRGKYKRSVLGWGWSLLNPIAMMLIYTLIFSLIFKQTIPPGDPSGLDLFPIYLLCGLLPWTYLSNSITGGMEALVGNASLIKKVYFPREVVVGAMVASWLVSFLIEMSVLTVAVLIVGNMVLPWLPVIVFFIAIETIYCVGIALLLSVCNVYFRDVRHIIAIVLQLWFYLTPIIYPIAFVPESSHGIPTKFIFLLNPMARFTRVFRNLIYDLRGPQLSDTVFLVVVAFLSFFVGLWAFRKLEPRLGEEL